MVLLKSVVLAGLAATVAAKSAILDLIPSNFDKVVLKSNKPALVEFFAPWCGHCKTLAPVYEELAQAFEFAYEKVSIAKVDADAERSLGKRFGVQGYPTLKWFDGKSDKPEEYKGGRDLESLTKFITDKTGIKPRKAKEPQSDLTWLTDANFKDVVGKDKHVIVAFTAPWCGHCKTLAPTWEKLATDFLNEAGVVVAKVDADSAGSKATAQAEGVKGYPTIKFYAAGSSSGEVYQGGRTEADLVKFLNSKAGTHRTVGGGLDGLAGTVGALDSIIKKYKSGGSVADLAKEAANVVTSASDAAQKQYGSYYLRVLEKIKQTPEFAQKELARLEKLLEDGSLALVKKDELTLRANVLRKFVKVTGGDRAKDEL